MNMTNSTKGKMYAHPATIKLFTDATWQFAHSVLWNDQPFSKAETALSKYYIREYYEAIPAEQFTKTVSQHFSAYCQRVMMAKKYVDRSYFRYIPHPIVWLDRRNPTGFAGTKKWYERQWRRRLLKRLIANAGLEKEFSELTRYATL
jgi:hypothetical protein